ncbi:MAG: hypothetical protein Q9160_007982 [Pyrenula sp. 1 TL-2023]
MCSHTLLIHSDCPHTTRIDPVDFRATDPNLARRCGYYPDCRRKSFRFCHNLGQCRRCRVNGLNWDYDGYDDAFDDYDDYDDYGEEDGYSVNDDEGTRNDLDAHGDNGRGSQEADDDDLGGHNGEEDEVSEGNEGNPSISPSSSTSSRANASLQEVQNLLEMSDQILRERRQGLHAQTAPSVPESRGRTISQRSSEEAASEARLPSTQRRRTVGGLRPVTYGIERRQ